MSTRGISPWNRKVLDEDVIRTLYEQRVSGERIAAQLGVTPPTIYARLHQMGLVRTNAEAHVGLQAGENNPNWTGGRTIKKNGYVWIRINGRQRLEHRVVMEQLLGRPLTSREVVHHKNHVRHDNRPENLQLLSSQSEHSRLHMSSGEAARRGRRGGWAKRAALKALGVAEVPER